MEPAQRKCRKKKYGDETSATAVLRRFARDKRPNKRHKEIRAYLCPCGFWHLTSKPLMKPLSPRRKLEGSDHVTRANA